MSWLRALGVDLGEARIGLATTETGLLTTPAGVIERTPRAAAMIAGRAADFGATVIVIGLPLKMRGGGEGTQAAATRVFAAEVQALTAIPVELYDERLTTVMADRQLSEHNRRGQRRRAERDALAAALILQGWLDRRRLAAAAADEAFDRP